jgi:hypothetical protein
MHKKRKASAKQNSYSRNAQSKEKGESPLSCTTGPRHHCRGGRGPLSNRPREGGREGGPPTLLLHASMPWRFRLVSLFFHTKPTKLHYKSMGGVVLRHTLICAQHLTSPLVLLSQFLVLVCEQRQKLLGELVSLEGKHSWYEYTYEEFFHFQALISFV